MGYRYRKDKTPDHMNDLNDLKDHAANVSPIQSDTSGVGRKNKLVLSDSLNKYEDKYNKAKAANDTLGANEAAKKFNKFSNDYQISGLVNDSINAVNNLKAARKVGVNKAAQDGKLKQGGEMFYGGGELTDKPLLKKKKP